MTSRSATESARIFDELSVALSLAILQRSVRRMRGCLSGIPSREGGGIAEGNLTSPTEFDLALELERKRLLPKVTRQTEHQVNHGRVSNSDPSRRDSNGETGMNVKKTKDTVAASTDAPSLTRRQIERADVGDLGVALEFDTELLQMFDLLRYDVEIDSTIRPALEAYIESAESGRCTACGSFILGMKALLHNYRPFASYVPGPQEPYPRAYEVIQAEIDSHMPNALSSLKDELELALAEEADLKMRRVETRIVKNDSCSASDHPSDGSWDDSDVSDELIREKQKSS
jgi:hypothetical protein